MPLYLHNVFAYRFFQMFIDLMLQQFQVMDKMDECGSNDTEARKLFHYRHPSPISVLEPYFPSESCNSSDSADSNSTQGNFPTFGQKVTNFSFLIASSEFREFNSR